MRFLTRALVTLIERAMASESVREALWRSGKDLFRESPRACQSIPSLAPLPQRFHDEVSSETSLPVGRPVFIIARFRSGSTFLWSLFRCLPEITAYYEPLNENCWFLRSAGETQVDSTHLGVEDYTSEYRGMDDLGRVFRKDWSFRRLYMDQTDYDPGLYHYIDALIERAAGRAILQFNRMDFRLPWLRANFPQALIVHLYRNPRETWMSILGKSGTSLPLSGDWNADHYRDLFYTYEWASDLKRVFPFLDPQLARHPYEVHYHLWRLSYSFGTYFSDYSLGYEDLVADLPRRFDLLSRELGVPGIESSVLQTMNRGRSEARWLEYADQGWFDEIERECERVQQAFFSPGRKAERNDTRLP